MRKSALRNLPLSKTEIQCEATVVWQKLCVVFEKFFETNRSSLLIIWSLRNSGNTVKSAEFFVLFGIISVDYDRTCIVHIGQKFPLDLFIWKN